MEPLISVQEIQKFFGSQKAVDGLSLSVGSGEIYGLVGPDGAGKTTCMRLLCAALRLDGGKVQVGGYDMERQIEQGRAQIGYLPQRFSMYEDLTVSENLRFFAEVRGLRPQEWQTRSQEILTFVGLYEYSRRLAGQLSGGMKQKLGLAAALVHRPRVLLLDEPTTGVDPVTRQDFWQLIIRLAAQDGIAVLVSTPYMDEAARCHRLGFMFAGRLLKEGTPAELRRLLDGQIVELIGQPLPRLRHLIRADPDVLDAQMFGDRLHLRVRAKVLDEVIARLGSALPLQNVEISDLRPIPAQLEDVFMALVEQSNG
jgi:ABC-2 type transport system ATP-binding protein